MKTISLFLTCMIAALFVQAQYVPPHTLSEIEVIPPKFTPVKAVKWETRVTVNDYIARNFVYPSIIGLPHEGTEVVQFTISPTGEIGKIAIINSVSVEIDNEIIRILRNTDRMWKPGQNNGIPVAMEKELAIEVKVGASETTAPNRYFTAIATDYFTKGAKKLLIKQKPRQAMHQFESAVRYKPYDKGALLMLALCKMELGKSEAAFKDIARLKKLGGTQSIIQEQLTENIQDLESYHTLMDELASR